MPVGRKRSATIISAYASTMTNPDDAKEFYEELDALISTVPQADKLQLLCDFNDRVGQDHQAWEGVIRAHRVGKCNSNGLLLLRTRTTHGLAITNTMFRLPTRKDRQDVRVTKAMCGADCWTDHCLIISKAKLHIQP